MTRITINEAAKQMGVQPQCVRVGITKGTIPIGNCFVNSGNKKTYLVFQELLDQFLAGERKGRSYGN